MVREFGWEVKKTAGEKRLIENGAGGLVKPTLDMYEKAKKSILELLKAADKLYEELKKKAAGLSGQAKEDIQMIKKYISITQGHLTLVNEVSLQ